MNNFFSSIGNFISGLFGSSSGNQTNTASVINGLDYSGNQKALDQYNGTGKTPSGASGSWGTPALVLQSPTWATSPTGTWQVPSAYTGGVPSANQYQTFTPTGGGYSSGGSSNMTSNPSGSNYQPYRFDPTTASAYMKSANVGNLDINGLTQQEADAKIGAVKANQSAQSNNANTSAVFGDSNMVSDVIKNLKDFKLSVDNISKDSWSSVGTKQDKIDNQLKSTVTDIVSKYDNIDQFANDVKNNPDLQAQLDTFLKAGGTSQDFKDKFTEKQANTNAVATNNNMSVVEYQNALAQQVPEAKVIQDEIARVAQIPENSQNAYFGDNGYIQQRINSDKERVQMLRDSIARAESSVREQLNYNIAKNNAEAEIARNTIELNRNNAKNYITGQLAKLGALNTTSAAVEGIATLDQKYQQQKSELDTKLSYQNQALEIEARNKINTLESGLDEKIQSIKEDLSKDITTITKEIAKEKQSAQKDIYNLTLKMNDAVKKNTDTYTSNATTMAEEYTKAFQSLVSQGYSPTSIAANLPSSIPKADQSISLQAHTKDPGAITFFKGLPAEFKQQWIDYAGQQGQNRYFTYEDIRQAFEAYQADKNVPNAPKATTTSNRQL